MSKMPADPANGQEIMRDHKALSALLRSQEAQRLIALLQSRGDLSKAATEASQGKTEPREAMINKLRQDPEGNQAFEALEQRLKQP